FIVGREGSGTRGDGDLVGEDVNTAGESVLVKSHATSSGDGRASREVEASVDSEDEEEGLEQVKVTEQVRTVANASGKKPVATSTTATSGASTA
ncbi:unnamed protein product, partial [Amoebophrya sp. A25]